MYVPVHVQVTYFVDSLEEMERIDAEDGDDDDDLTAKVKDR